jgi:hypothetical protein
VPARVLDFEAIWTSDKIAACREDVRVEYVWFYGLADANGSFEINLRSIWSRLSAIRPKLTIRKIEQILNEFEARGLLFTWIDPLGKKFGHWVGSERRGRLPKPSERHKFKIFTPDVPIEGLAAFEARFASRPTSRSTSRPTSRSTSRPTSRSTSHTGLGLGLGGGSGAGLGARDGEGVGRGVGEPGGEEAETQGVSETQRPKTLLEGNQNHKPLCDHCGLHFSTLPDLINHDCPAKTTAGWECRNCRSTFPDIRSLKSHRREAHA